MSAILKERLHYADEGGSGDSRAAMDDDNNPAFHYGTYGGGGGAWEIEEERSSELQEIGIVSCGGGGDRRGATTRIGEEGESEESVYVGVGKSETSMEALSWTLNHLISASPSNNTMVYLIHVFPEIKHIPNPLGMGMIPKSQVSAEQIESYMAQERGKRRELLQKFIHSCSASKMKVDTILIESDMVAKAILDLVPILNIRTLVIGTNKSNMRKSRSRKGSNGIANQILQNAPESCRVRIISEGKEVNEQMKMMTTMMSSPSPRANANSDHASSMAIKEEDRQNDTVSCICFKPMFK